MHYSHPGFIILWMLFLVISIMTIFEVFHIVALTKMFPEGRRWWTLPSAYLALSFFAVVVLMHPLTGN